SAPFVEPTPEELLNLQSFQCTLSSGIFPLLSRKLKIRCRHQPGTPSSRFQDGVDKVARGGFPIGTCHTDGREVLCRVVIKSAGEICQRYAYIPHFDVRQRQVLRGLHSLAERYTCATSCRIVQKEASIGMY